MDVPDYAIEITMFWTWMGSDGIARTKTKPNAEILLQHAKENTDAVTSLYKGKKFPLLIDSRNIRSMDKDARAHFSTNGRETKINSFAVVVKSPLSRIIGNFFMGLNKPQVPARLFDNEKEAIKWLSTFM